MNERDLVRLAAQLFSPRIGDDGAVLDGQVITTDMLVEGVDFTRQNPLPLLARKSLAVNLSDLAAMGAVPAYAVAGLCLPDWVLYGIPSFLQAMADAARQWRVEIVGGDFSRGDSFVISVAAVGSLPGRPLLRSGARPGERIFLSRPVGGSAAGLQLLSRGWSASGDPPSAVGFAEREFALSAIQRHLDPEPEMALGPLLASIPEVTACIDVSDGLSTDLHHLCEASRCGAQVERERIPMFPDLLGSGTSLGVHAREAVLHGGEEYALLFTSSLRESELSARLGRPVYAIGRMTAEPEVRLVEDGKPTLLKARGWDHFRG